MSKLKVLLVEDHLGERLNLIKFLHPYDVEVDTAITFSRARDLVSKRKYDIVVSELLLSHCPELQGDGIQFWKHFQAIHPITPIFLIAPTSVCNHVEILLDGGERPPVFSRPFCAELLKDAIEKDLFNLRRLVA